MCEGGGMAGDAGAEGGEERRRRSERAREKVHRCLRRTLTQTPS